MQTEKSKQRHGKRYDIDLRAEAVKQIQGGKKYREVAQSVGASEPTIRAWVHSYRPPTQKREEAGSSTSDIAKMRRELDDLKLEYQAVKDTLSYIIKHAGELWR